MKCPTNWKTKHYKRQPDTTNPVGIPNSKPGQKVTIPLSRQYMTQPNPQ